MDSVWRNRLLIGWAILLALAVAYQIAYGTMVWPIFAGCAAAALILARVQPVPVGALVVGVVLAGYMVGNRGFAQLSLAGNLPLLPAETALLCGGIAVLARSVSLRRFPMPRDALSAAVAMWIVIGSLRLLFDLKHGFLAVRDFATVYYALFFFLAQDLAEDRIAERFLNRSLCVGGVLLLLVQPLYAAFPEFFLTGLTVRGTPLIYYKGDLLVATLAITSLIFHQLYEQRARWGYWLVSLCALGPVLYTNNRASRAGLVVGSLFLLVGRRYRYVRMQCIVAACGAAGVLLVAAAQGKGWETTPLYDVYEQAVSLTDYSGKQTYRGETTFNKGDNNAFRTVWWREAVRETVNENPWLGLGFGHDLAQGFLDRYYPTSDYDFNIRSPHNILVTVFARMGLLGLLSFLSVVGLLIWQAAAAVRLPKVETWPAALACSCIALLVCACFGVVLEGPMGAMLFWVMLGLLNRALHTTAVAQGESVADTVSAVSVGAERAEKSASA